MKKTEQEQAAPMTKADFIRSQPADMHPADVVAAAEAAGISMTKTNVYMTRATDKAQKERAKKPMKKSPPAKANKVVAKRKAAKPGDEEPASFRHSLAAARVEAAGMVADSDKAIALEEREFKIAIAEIGIVRAAKILAIEVERIGAMRDD